MAPLRIEEVERAIGRLAGIYEARAFLEKGDGSIEKIHVMVAPGRAPKKIVRDIETLLLLKFNLNIDYRKISLVQVRLEDVRPFIRRRLRLIRVEQGQPNGVRRVEIKLESESEVYVGCAEGPVDSDPAALAAQATLNALTPMLEDATVALDLVEMVPLHGDTAMLVALTAGTTERRDRLLGSCFFQGDPLEAAARSTLDAMNRRFFNA